VASLSIIALCKIANLFEDLLRQLRAFDFAYHVAYARAMRYMQIMNLPPMVFHDRVSLGCSKISVILKLWVEIE